MLPCVPVNVDVSSQAFLLHTSVVDIIVEEYPPEASVPKDPWISDKTFALQKTCGKVLERA